MERFQMMSDGQAKHEAPACSLRILFVFEQYSRGGFETHLDTLIEALSGFGIDSYCLGGPDFGRSSNRCRVRGYVNADLQTFTGATVERCARQIADIVRRERIDVVHVHPFLSFLPGALGAMLADVPYVVSFHGPPSLPLWVPYFGGFFVESLAKFVLPRATAISSVSEEARDVSASMFGVSASNIMISRNPIDFERFQSNPKHPDASDLCALLVSRLDDDKYSSITCALDFFRHLKNQRPGSRLRVAGSGEREQDLRDYTRRNSISDVEWLGHQDDVGSLIAQSDLVIGMGRVMIEAVAAKRLAVLAGHGGLAGIIDAGNFSELQRLNFGGRGLPPVDPASLVRTAVALLDAGNGGAELLRDLVARDHDSHRIAASWLEVYQRAASTRPGLPAKSIAEQAVFWLSTVGTASLRSLEWATLNPVWPTSILGNEATGTLLRQAIDLRATESHNHTKALDARSKDRASVQTELDDLIRRTGQQDEQIADLRQQNGHLVHQTADLRSQLDHQRGRAEALESECQAAKEELGASIRDCGKLQAERDALIGQVGQKDALLQAARDELTSQLAAEREVRLSVERRIAGVSAGLEIAVRRIQQLEANESELLARDCIRDAELTSRTRESEELAHNFQQRIDQIAQTAEERERRLADLRNALATAEKVRQLTLNRCHQFRTSFEEQLNVYRGQRAWRVMLWCRKAYALFFSSPLAGKLRFLRFAFSTLWNAGEGTKEDDLYFPSLPSFMPRQIMAPFVTDRKSEGETEKQSCDGAYSDTDGTVLPKPREYDVIILAIIDFDTRFQRPQQIAARFAKRGHRVFWVSPTRFLPPASSNPYELREIRENLWEVHLRGSQPDIYLGSLDKSETTTLLHSLSRLYRDCGVVENCAILQLPFWRQIGLGLRATFGTTVLYDCMDEWETFPSMGEFNLSEERLLAGECDVLVVTAQKLGEKFKQQGLAPLLARNAADFDFFATATGKFRLPEDIRRPVVGYFGAIADWMDLDLVAEVAQLRPQYSFVLIGQVFGRDTSRLKSLPNVYLLGHKDYEEIPLYLRDFDVCMIPFLVNQVTNATDPVKLYEYFSQGKPVVATNMEELVAWSDLLYLGRNEVDFAEKLDQAVGEQDASLAVRRVDFARANTWAHRVEAIDRAVRKTFPLVSVLIVTYNSEEFVRPCLDSLLRNTTYPNLEIIVVDNASTDETQASLRSYSEAHSNVRVYCLPDNRGFAGGNNDAARQASGEYLVFLNPDTIVTVGWLEYLLRHCRRDKTIGLLAAVTNFAGNEVKINVDYENQEQMELFAARTARSHAGETFDVEAVPLYCVLMPTFVWDRTGELDEKFEIGMFEDDDLSLRVRAAGFRVAAAQDCFIHHFGQGSFSKLPNEDYQRVFDRNRELFEAKWNRTWEPHRPRSGVRPAHEEKRFDPRSFCGARCLSSVSANRLRSRQC